MQLREIQSAPLWQDVCTGRVNPDCCSIWCLFQRHGFQGGELLAALRKSALSIQWAMHLVQEMFEKAAQSIPARGLACSNRAGLSSPRPAFPSRAQQPNWDRCHAFLGTSTQLSATHPACKSQSALIMPCQCQMPATASRWGCRRW